ncbi:DNA alkylation repair protein [Aquimarina sp. 2304DJ70-9]|uniref:DNA alkylation repair protein n=1 Tax=Aquimarina penaris TaxID=3231044 RepID=UPI003462F572
MEIPKEILNRKGVRKATDINPEVLELLEKGMIETVNLTEWLAINQLKVLKTVLNELRLENHFPEFEAVVNSQKKPTSNSNTKVIGSEFVKLVEFGNILSYLKSHPSDVVRCWACWVESSNANTTKELLKKMKPYAADAHFGVREVVIFASKEQLTMDLVNSINLLKKWCTSEEENIRRYVAEVLRPNGVWTKKVDALHQNPELGFPLISPLKSDSSKYVQNSVANWLNDASKSNPGWVRNICMEWEKQPQTKETAYIVKRAMRTINK